MGSEVSANLLATLFDTVLTEYLLYRLARIPTGVQLYCLRPVICTPSTAESSVTSCTQHTTAIVVQLSSFTSGTNSWSCIGNSTQSRTPRQKTYRQLRPDPCPLSPDPRCTYSVGSYDPRATDRRGPSGERAKYFGRAEAEPHSPFARARARQPPCSRQRLAARSALVFSPVE